MGSAALRLLRLLGIRYLMAARSIWNGTVAFGLVNVPVKLYSATESKTVWFSDVYARDGADRAPARLPEGYELPSWPPHRCSSISTHLTPIV